MSVPAPFPEAGLELLARDGRGRLVVTDDWLRRQLDRPELALVAESCPQEHALHRALAADPRTPVTPVTLLRIRDPDARENWELFVRFRDHLLRHPTVEDAYLALFLEPTGLPVLFADELARLLLAAILAEEGAADPFRRRAALLFFRPQRVSVVEGAVLVADAEAVARSRPDRAYGGLGALVQAAGAVPLAPELPVLGPERTAEFLADPAPERWILDLTFGREGLDALCRLLEAWVRRLLDVTVTVQPLARVRDERWRWHVGLDAEASALLDDLYRGHEVEEARLRRLLALFRLDFRDPSVVLAEMRGRPVYLGLAHDADGRLRMKPQNLAVNLPLAEVA